VGNAIGLWRVLEAMCTVTAPSSRSPHNINMSWGPFYGRYTFDGGSYDDEGWRLRKRREPIAEMYPVKGAPEYALGLGGQRREVLVR
jgi:hypothetical protein